MPIIMGMPLQLIIMGMPMPIIFIISSQQLLNISMFIPSGQVILQVMPSAVISQLILAIMGIIIGIIPDCIIPIGICMAGIIMAFLLQ